MLYRIFTHDTQIAFLFLILSFSLSPDFHCHPCCSAGAMRIFLHIYAFTLSKHVVFGAFNYFVEQAKRYFCAQLTYCFLHSCVDWKNKFFPLLNNSFENNINNIILTNAKSCTFHSRRQIKNRNNKIEMNFVCGTN